jgi:outer membrane protein assembly factor BamB
MCLAAAVACGNSPSTTGSTSGTRVAASSRPGQSSGQAAGGLLVISSLNAKDSMSVRLVDRSGGVMASTQFTPPPLPAFAYCADVVQLPVRVADGAAYFADSSGLVRRLSVDGAISSVATFKLTKQQALSFAVSPDGKQLIAIVLSTPPLRNPPPQRLGDPVFGPGTWSLDLETAMAGGTTTVVLHTDLGTSVPSPTVITGWDQFGPTATLNSQICTQNSLPSFRYTGTLVHMALDGTHLDRIGGPDCNAWDELFDGTVLCGGSDRQSFSVRQKNGDVLWSRSDAFGNDVKLAPDGNGVASAGVVYLRNSSQAASFAPQTAPEPPYHILGWADSGHVVTIANDGRLGLADAAVDPLTAVDLGLTLNVFCELCIPYRASLIGTIG